MRPTDYIIPAFVYGFLIFLLYSIVENFWNSIAIPTWMLPRYELFPTSGSPSAAVSGFAIVWAIAIGFILALAISALQNKKYLHRFAKYLGITKKFGDRDVWSYIMNSNDTDWLLIRDRDSGLFFVGRLVACSDEEPNREMVLSNTIAYDNETGDQRYEAGSIYFSFPREGLTIEIPKGDSK